MSQRDGRGCGDEAEPQTELSCDWPSCGSVLVVDARTAPNGTTDASEVVILASSNEATLVKRLLSEGAEASAIEPVRAARIMGTLTRVISEPSPASKQNDTPRLTPREAEVLELVALGYTNPEIAAQLVISVRTVEAHRRNMAKKTGCGTRAELVSFGLGNGLIER